MSPRSLHRQFQEEGASLQQLKDEVRFERAKDLLLRTLKPIKQVAAASGFRNEKSFMRAFREWVGVPPDIFKNQSPKAKCEIFLLLLFAAKVVCNCLLINGEKL